MEEANSGPVSTATQPRNLVRNCRTAGFRGDELTTKPIFDQYDTALGAYGSHELVELKCRAYITDCL
jgi:hypothetical protein